MGERGYAWNEKVLETIKDAIEENKHRLSEPLPCHNFTQTLRIKKYRNGSWELTGERGFVAYIGMMVEIPSYLPEDTGRRVRELIAKTFGWMKKKCGRNGVE